MDFKKLKEIIQRWSVDEEDGVPANATANVAGIGSGPPDQAAPPGPSALGGVNHLFRRKVPKLGESELDEADDFVLAWNASTAKKGKDARPIPITFRRFSKFSPKGPPAGFKGHCYANSLDNYKKRGLKMVVGFAVPEKDVQQLLKTGELSWNNLYRGYEHAWNIDKNGEIIDSTYRNEAKDFRYYGMVVPDVTASSFRNDDGVREYVRDFNAHFDAHREKSYEKAIAQQKTRPMAIQSVVPKYDEKLKDRGYEFYEASHSVSSGNINYMYINKKNAGKLYFTWNSKTSKTQAVSLITRGQYGENEAKRWLNLDDFLEKKAPQPRIRY